MRLLAPIALAALLSSCGSAPPPPAAAPPPPEPCVEPRPRVTIAASGQSNAGPDGRGLPVQVRLYQLRSEARLLNAFFEEIWKDDATTLADDLVSMREVTVFPGQRQSLELEQSEQSQVLAAVALFREPRGRDWFVSYDLASAREEPPCPPAEPRISIWLDRMKVQDGEGRVETAPEAPPPGAPSEVAPSGSDNAAAGEGR